MGTILVTKEGDKVLNDSDYKFYKKTGVPQQVINSRLRVTLMSLLIARYPYLMTPEEQSAVDRGKRWVMPVIALSTVLYFTSIFWGRKLIKRNHRIKLTNVKLAGVYFFPLCIGLPLIQLLIRGQRVKAREEVSRMRTESMPNEKLFAYTLSFYSTRFEEDIIHPPVPLAFQSRDK